MLPLRKDWGERWLCKGGVWRGGEGSAEGGVEQKLHFLKRGGLVVVQLSLVLIPLETSLCVQKMGRL